MFTNDPNEPITKSLHYQNLNRKPGDIFSDFEYKPQLGLLATHYRDFWDFNFEQPLYVGTGSPGKIEQPNKIRSVGPPGSKPQLQEMQEN